MTEYFLYNILQMLVVLLFAPLMTGISAWLKERVQSHRGPSILQPYFDLWKLFHKDEIVSQESTWIFRATPYVLFVTPLIVALLIPVLTDYPLFFAFMGDMLAGGFILALGGFFAALAAIDTANPYGPMGASRTRMVGFLAEPVFIIVFFYGVHRGGLHDSIHRSAAVGTPLSRILRPGPHSSYDCLLHAHPGGDGTAPGRQPFGPL